MRKRYNPQDRIIKNHNLPGIITLSHGPLAEAIIDSTSLLFMGPIENSASFCLEDGDDLEEYREAFVAAIRAFPEGSIVFVDLFGGSPSNQLLTASQIYQDLEGKLFAIGGMNLSMVLNAALLRQSKKGQELLDLVIADGGDSIVDMTAKMALLKEKE